MLTGTQRGGLVYHWKHGWVPRDHFAALAKAHGSKTGAAKIMDKHGIAHDGSGHSAHPVTRTHPVGARVEARQPGIDHVTHGQVVGHTDTGMVQVQHTNRHGQGVVGIFNPSHTSVVGTGATTHEPHAAPHSLKPGEHAMVRGTDHMGQPITLTGKVTSNSPAAEFGRGRTTGGKPLRTLGIERQGASGMTRTDHVNVPDPSRGEVRRQSNAQALTAAREAEISRSHAVSSRAHVAARTQINPSSGDIAEAAAQWKQQNPGRSMAGHEHEVNRLAEDIAHRKFVQTGQRGNTDAQKAAERSRVKASAAFPHAMVKRLAAEKDAAPSGKDFGGANEAVRAANVERAKTGVLKRATRQNGSVGGMGIAGGSSDTTRPIAEALTRAASTGRTHYVQPGAYGMTVTSTLVGSPSHIRVSPNGDVHSIPTRDWQSGKMPEPTARMADSKVAEILNAHLSPTRKREPSVPSAPKAPPAARVYSPSEISAVVSDMKKNPSLQTPAFKAKIVQEATRAGALHLVPVEWGGTVKVKRK